MTVNSSFDLFSHPLYMFSNSSLVFKTNPCFMTETSIVIFSALSFANLLLLPLFILVLYAGCQQRRQQRSTSTTATTHSNLFIYHSITMQLTVFWGFSCFYFGGFFNLPNMMFIGLSVWSVTYIGQGLFHTLTCVERYLAVVHPITYLHLRQAGEARIRNISIGCVWLLTFAWLAVCILTSSTLYFILYCCCMSLVLVVITLSSVSVLCALKRPGPGEVGGNMKRVDHTKQRAFINIFLILGVLLIRFVGNLSGTFIYTSDVVNASNICVVFLSLALVDIPSSLVLPLLFLQRIGKLQCCKQKSESG